jgi:hypothetical protein
VGAINEVPAQSLPSEGPPLPTLPSPPTPSGMTAAALSFLPAQNPPSEGKHKKQINKLTKKQIKKKNKKNKKKNSKRKRVGSPREQQAQKTWLGRLYLRLFRNRMNRNVDDDPLPRSNVTLSTMVLEMPGGGTRKINPFELGQEIVEDDEDEMLGTKVDPSIKIDPTRSYYLWQEILNRNQKLNRRDLFRLLPIKETHSLLRGLQEHQSGRHSVQAYRISEYNGVKRHPSNRLKTYYQELFFNKNAMQFRTLWWKKVLPNLRAQTDVIWRNQQDRLLKKRMNSLSGSNIIELNKKVQAEKSGLSVVSSFSSSLRSDNEAGRRSSDIGSGLEIGDYDFKPLTMPEAIQLREKRMNANSSFRNQAVFSDQTSEQRKAMNPTSNASNALESLEPRSTGSSSLATHERSQPTKPLEFSLGEDFPSYEANPGNLLFVTPQQGFARKKSNQGPKNLISKVLKTTFLKENSTPPGLSSSQSPWNKALIPTTNLPFYAGWDESLRKFVVTNRLLTLRDAESELRIRNNYDSRLTTLINLPPEPGNITHLKFSSPMKGLGAGVAMYIIIPFGSYDTDQFYPAGVDGFTPYGWRRFTFRQTLLKTWLYERAANLNSNSRNRRKSKSKVIVRNKSTIVNPSIASRLKNKTRIVGSSSSSSLFQPLGSERRQRSSDKIASKFKYKIDEKLNPLFSATQIFNKGSRIQLKNRLTHKMFNEDKNEGQNGQEPNQDKNRPPVGPRLHHILPNHYTHLIYMGLRDPLTYMMRQRLRKNLPESLKLANPSGVLEDKGTNPFNRGAISDIKFIKFAPDFTLRLLVKPNRFYHIKTQEGDLYEDPYIVPRRVKFLRQEMKESALAASSSLSSSSERREHAQRATQRQRQPRKAMRWRPIGVQTVDLSISTFVKEMKEARYIDRNTLKLDPGILASKKPEEARTIEEEEQIKERSFEKRIVSQIHRYIPRAEPLGGGYVWDDDYFQLNPTFRLLEEDDHKNQNYRLKQKSLELAPIFEMRETPIPRELHNYNVLKTKLKKAKRSNKLRERMKQLRNAL